MDNRFAISTVLFLVLSLRGHLCNGGLLDQTLKLEQRLSNGISNTQEAFQGLLLIANNLASASGTAVNGLSPNIQDTVPRGPLLFTLRLINSFLANRVQPYVQLSRAVANAFSPLRDGIRDGILFGLRKFNEFIVYALKHFHPLKDLLKKKPSAAKNVLQNITDRIGKIIDNIKQRARNRMTKNSGPIMKMVYPFISQTTSGLVQQVIIQSLSKMMSKLQNIQWHPLRNALSKVLDKLHSKPKPTTSPEVVPRALRTRLMLAIARIIPPWLWLRILNSRLLKGLTGSKKPKLSLLSLIFYLQWQIAKSLADINESVKEIIRSLIAIVTNFRKYLSQFNPINKLIARVGQVAGFFGVGAPQPSFRGITRLLKAAGTLFNLGKSLTGLSGIGGNIAGILGDLLKILPRLIGRVFG